MRKLVKLNMVIFAVISNNNVKIFYEQLGKRIIV